MLWPYHAALASNYTKDTLFSAFLTLFFALTLEMLQTRQINRSLFCRRDGLRRRWPV